MAVLRRLRRLRPASAAIASGGTGRTARHSRPPIAAATMRPAPVKSAGSFSVAERTSAPAQIAICASAVDHSGRRAFPPVPRAETKAAMSPAFKARWTGPPIAKTPSSSRPPITSRTALMSQPLAKLASSGGQMSIPPPRPPARARPMASAAGAVPAVRDPATRMTSATAAARKPPTKTTACGAEPARRQASLAAIAAPGSCVSPGVASSSQKPSPTPQTVITSASQAARAVDPTSAPTTSSRKVAPGSSTSPGIVSNAKASPSPWNAARARAIRRTTARDCEESRRRSSAGDAIAALSARISAEKIGVTPSAKIEMRARDPSPACWNRRQTSRSSPASGSWRPN